MRFLNTSLSSAGGGNLTHPVYEGYSHEDFGAQHIIMESQDDTLYVFEALSDVDIFTLRGESQEVMESAVGNVVERAKTALKKLWGKIKAFFEMIVRYFDALTKSAAAFAKKYEKQLTTKSLSNFKYKMFNYTIPEAPEKNATAAETVLGETAVEALEDLKAGASLDGAKEKLKDLRESYEEIQNGIRSAMVGTKVDGADEYKKALYAAFRNGAESKEDADEISVDIRAIIETVKASPKLKRAVEAAKRHTDETFNKYIKALTKAHTEASKDKEASSEALSVLSGAVGVTQKTISFTKSVTVEFYNAWLSAIKERDSVYKSVMSKAFRHNDNKED